jgi:cohesin complex subunit SA-1/2
MHATGILYDEIALIENVHLWVTTMSSSYLRPFRHTATLIALSLTTALCEVCKQQAAVTSNTLHQLEGEKKKKPRNQGRIEEFKKKVAQGNERQETCRNTLQDFFDTVFVHRYRDVDPKIRTDCVEALGQWIKILPDVFFDSNHLRYLGWMLSDAYAPTRHETVKQLEKVMKSGKDVGILRSFIDRFRPRIVEMATQDSETSVRVSAVDLLDLIRQEGILEPDDIDTVGQLIFDSEARVRRAVVGFFAENIKDLYEAKIEELGGEEALEEVLAAEEDDYKTPRAGWITLKCLAEVLSSYDADDSEGSQSQFVDSAENDFISHGSSESRFTLATQALYEKVPDISTWEILAGYLLFDHSASIDSTSAGADVEQNLRASFKLSEKEEVILLEVLNASVKLSLSMGDEHEKGKDSLKKKKLSKAELAEAQESTARRLAGLIPQLLKKFSANPATTTAVLRLEHVLNLGVFQQLRQDGAFAALLHEITSQFSAHADQRVLTEASAAILHAKGFEDLEEITEEQVQSLWENTIADFRKRFPKTNVMSVRGDSDTKQLTDLRNIVTRIGKLASISDPTERFESTPVVKGRANERAKLPVIDMLLECVGRGFLEESQPDIDDFEDRLVSSACQATLFYFMWKARSLQALVKASNEIPDIDVDQIKERLDTFTGNLIRVFSSRADVDEIRLITTGVLLDIYSLYSTFSPSKQSKDATAADKYAYLQTFIYEAESDVQEEITTIFAQLEQKYAKKAHKSLEAPADDDEPEDLESEPEDDDDVTDAERKGDILTVERQLCDLSAKLVLAILAGVIDVSGPLKGKLRTRIQRNRLKLGANFKEVIAYLDDDRLKESGQKKSHKSKAHQAAIESRKKSKMLVEEDDDEEEEEEEEEDEDQPEEGTAEDLRRRELLEDDPGAGVDIDEDVEEHEEEEDDVMGD